MASLCTSSSSSLPMFFTGVEPCKVQFDRPAQQETELTPLEIEEMLTSLLQEGNVDSNVDSGSPNNSGSDGSNRAVYTVNERKRRRMKSNRESARRSRWRKKRHLEDLTEEANRMKTGNSELKSRLDLVLRKCYLTWRENDQLESESLALRARLSYLERVLVAMQIQQQSHAIF